jgi:hypothetical protein
LIGGPSFTVSGFSELGSTLSVHCDTVASALSVRGFLNIGGTLSVADAINVAGILSVRNFVRLGTFEIYAGLKRMISTNEYGEGRLHGVWFSDTDISTSDLRLKTNVEPLDRRLDRSSSSSASVLRELRPVAFELKEDPARRTRFGFIAQELERVLPEVVYDEAKSGLSDEPGLKGVIYQDLIAVLTVALQEHQAELDVLRDQVDQLRHSDERKQRTLEHLLDRVAALERIKRPLQDEKAGEIVIA